MLEVVLKLLTPIHLLLSAPYSIYMRVSHPISLSYLTMVSNSSLKGWETLILFLEVGGEANRFETLKIRNEIGVWLEMFFPFLSPQCRVGGQIGCGLELLLVQGIALGLSNNGEFGPGKGARQGERTGAKASVWMSFRWIYLNQNRLSMCQHLLDCLLVSSPMNQTWMLWIWRELAPARR